MNHDRTFLFATVVVIGAALAIAIPAGCQAREARRAAEAEAVRLDRLCEDYREELCAMQVEITGGDTRALDRLLSPSSSTNESMAAACGLVPSQFTVLEAGQCRAKGDMACGARIAHTLMELVPPQKDWESLPIWRECR